MRKYIGKSYLAMQSNYNQESDVRFHIKYNFSRNWDVEYHNNFCPRLTWCFFFLPCQNTCLSRKSSVSEEQALAGHHSTAMKSKNINGCFPSLPSVTAFHFHLFSFTVLVNRCFFLLCFIRLSHKI